MSPLSSTDLTELEELRAKVERVQGLIDVLDSLDGSPIDSDLVADDLRDALSLTDDEEDQFD